MYDLMCWHVENHDGEKLDKHGIATLSFIYKRAVSSFQPSSNGMYATMKRREVDKRMEGIINPFSLSQTRRHYYEPCY